MHSRDTLWASYHDVMKMDETPCGCKRKKVRAVLCGLQDGRLVELASAMNGPVGGPCSGEIGNCGCIHAEVALLLKVPRTQKGILCVGYSPCTNCANAIIASQSVIAVLYSSFTTHDPRGVQWLTHAGIFVLQEGEVWELAAPIFAGILSCYASLKTVS